MCDIEMEDTEKIETHPRKDTRPASDLNGLGDSDEDSGEDEDERKK